MTTTSKRRWIAAAALVVAAATATPADAHPFHYTLSEVELKPAEKRLEVALRVSLIDLEPEFRRRAGRSVDLESTAVEEILAQLATESFSVVAGESPLQLAWVGSEVDRRDAWLYFTFSLDEVPEELRFRVTLFFGEEPAQQNIIRFRAPGVDETLRCTPQDPEAVFTLGDRDGEPPSSASAESKASAVVDHEHGTDHDHESSHGHNHPTAVRGLDGRLVVDARDLVASVRDAVVVVSVADRAGAPSGGVGGGVIVDPAGLVATSLHVIGEGRPITVTLASGEQVAVTAIEAWDRLLDLAILRVDADSLPALPLRIDEPIAAGEPVVAIGSPLGLEQSVSVGVVSGSREVAGRPLLQLAAAVEPGSSGGPVIDLQGRVIGLVVLKSTAAEAIAFAAPAADLQQLLESPHPTLIADWATIGALDPEQWKIRWDGDWRRRAGAVIADGVGSGFGGRTACVSTRTPPELPYEASVEVKIDNVAGAAGLGVGFDEAGRHVGFYPSAGGLRLTHFAGDDVYSWKILHDARHEAYRPGEWNELRVVVQDDQTECFVNGRLAATGPPLETPAGPAGLLQFRGTAAEFRRFQLRPADKARDEEGSTAAPLLAEGDLEGDTRLLVDQLAPRTASRATLLAAASEAQSKAERLRRLAGEVHRRQVCMELADLLGRPDADERLAEATLVAARLDDPDLDVEYYLAEIDRLAARVASATTPDASERDRLDALVRVLFRELGFHGGRSEYYHRKNSYLNSLLDDREGLPITLSVLFIELGRRLGLDVSGAPLPGRFMVRYAPSDGSEEGIRFVDVFAGGTILDRGDVLKLLGPGHRPETLGDAEIWGPASTRAIVARMFRNLLNSASADRRPEDLPRYLDALIAVEPPERAAEYLWARAMLYYEQGRTEAALRDLDQLAENPPPGVDAVQMRRLREGLRQSMRRPGE